MFICESISGRFVITSSAKATAKTMGPIFQLEEEELEDRVIFLPGKVLCELAIYGNSRLRSLMKWRSLTSDVTSEAVWWL